MLFKSNFGAPLLGLTKYIQCINIMPLKGHKTIYVKCFAQINVLVE